MSVSEWDVCERCGGSGTVCHACSIQDWEYCDPEDCPVCQGLGRVPPDNVVEAAAKAIWRVRGFVGTWEEAQSFDVRRVGRVRKEARAALVAAALEERHV